MSKESKEKEETTPIVLRVFQAEGTARVKAWSGECACEFQVQQGGW